MEKLAHAGDACLAISKLDCECARVHACVSAGVSVWVRVRVCGCECECVGTSVWVRVCECARVHACVSAGTGVDASVWV